MTIAAQQAERRGATATIRRGLSLSPELRRGLPATLLLALLVCAAGTAPTVAQDRLERLEISLWPEYDRPAMLVMLRAWLPADAEFPVTISLPMPAMAIRSVCGSSTREAT